MCVFGGLIRVCAGSYGQAPNPPQNTHTHTQAGEEGGVASNNVEVRLDCSD